MAKPSLKLYFDILSPFAYIAFHVIRVRAALDFFVLTLPCEYLMF